MQELPNDALRTRVYEAVSLAFRDLRPQLLQRGLTDLQVSLLAAQVASNVVAGLKSAPGVCHDPNSSPEPIQLVGGPGTDLGWECGHLPAHKWVYTSGAHIP